MSLSHDPLQYLVESHPRPQSQVGSKEVERVKETKPVNRGLLDPDSVVEHEDDGVGPLAEGGGALQHLDLRPQAGRQAGRAEVAVDQESCRGTL